MYTIGEIIELCNCLAPPELAESYDNVGLLVGDSHVEVAGVLCALDLNEAVIEEACERGANCIITHHPFIFRGLKRVDLTTPQGRMLKQLLVHDIHVIAMHTNLDIVQGGINDYLAEQLHLTDTKVLSVTGVDATGRPYGIGRVGTVAETKLDVFVEQVKAVFHIPYIRVVGATTNMIRKVAICSGSGSSFISDACRYADIYITGDMTFHEAQAAKDNGLVVLDVGHYASENKAIPLIQSYLQKEASGLNVMVSKVNGEVFEIR